jgi:hypothetical protein
VQALTIAAQTRTQIEITKLFFERPARALPARNMFTDGGAKALAGVVHTLRAASESAVQQGLSPIDRLLMQSACEDRESEMNSAVGLTA